MHSGTPTAEAANPNSTDAWTRWSRTSTYSPETASRLFRDYIIRGELEEARAGQQQVIELVDDIEGEVSSSVIGSQHYQQSLSQGLSALQEPIIDDLPGVLSELQESTQLMHDQQEKFLYRLRAAQQEITHLRSQLERAHLAATLDSLTRVFNRHAFTRLLERALSESTDGLALLMLDIDHFKQFNDQYGHPWATAYSSMSANCCATCCHPRLSQRAMGARSSASCCAIAPA